jgi:hypothetical protein
MRVKKCTKKRSKNRDRKFFLFFTLKEFFDYLAFEKAPSPHHTCEG